MPSRARTERSSPVNFNTADQSVHVDWSAYAKSYDLMSEHNPEYQALLQGFEAFLATIETPKLIYDIGGGTGKQQRGAVEPLDRSGTGQTGHPFSFFGFFLVRLVGTGAALDDGGGG